MVAYSFKKQFVEPIKVGLGERRMHFVHPKRQTIRADRKRHARPGEELQLYCGMRTKGCFLIGRARCTKVKSIFLYFEPGHDWGFVRVDNAKTTMCEPHELEKFARSDGFASFKEMREFWNAEHPGVVRFEGVIIKWEPL